MKKELDQAMRVFDDLSKSPVSKDAIAAVKKKRRYKDNLRLLLLDCSGRKSTPKRKIARDTLRSLLSVVSTEIKGLLAVPTRIKDLSKLSARLELVEDLSADLSMLSRSAIEDLKLSCIGLDDLIPLKLKLTSLRIKSLSLYDSPILEESIVMTRIRELSTMLAARIGDLSTMLSPRIGGLSTMLSPRIGGLSTMLSPRIGGLSTVLSPRIGGLSMFSTEIEDSSMFSTEIEDSSMLSTEIEDSSMLSTEIEDSSMFSTEIEDLSKMVSTEIEDLSKMVSTEIEDLSKMVSTEIEVLKSYLQRYDMLHQLIFSNEVDEITSMLDSLQTYLNELTDCSSGTDWWLWCCLFWLLFSSLCFSLLTSRALAQLLVAVIILLLLSSGDIERNPGPGPPIYRDDKPTLKLLQYMSYTSEDGQSTVHFRLMKRVKERVEQLATALDIPEEIRDVLKTKQDPAYYMFSEWLKLGHDCTWDTLLTALNEADLQEEVKILKENFVIKSPSVSDKRERDTELRRRDEEIRRQQGTINYLQCQNIFLCLGFFVIVIVLVAVLLVLTFGNTAVPSISAWPRDLSDTHCCTVNCPLLHTATPPAPPSPGSTITQHVTSEKALVNEFPVSYITDPLALCACLNNDNLYIDCQQIVSDHYMPAKTATLKILGMWFKRSPKLTWEEVADTLFRYGLANIAAPLAKRHGVDCCYKRKN